MQTALNTETPSALPAALQPRRRLATIPQASAAYPAFTAAALRDIVFRAFERTNSRGERIAGNGLGEAGAVLRLGRKVLLDLDKFEAWIDSRGAMQ